MKRAKLGVSAALTPGLTIHTATFETAVRDVMNGLSDDVSNGIELVWACDQMSSAGGHSASIELLGHDVDLVVGHFSSLAASAAIPNYLCSKTPVILPCSTQDNLTDANIGREKALVFRLSMSDRKLVESVTMLLHALNVDVNALSAWSGNSAYAKRLLAIHNISLPLEKGASRVDAAKAHLLLGHHDEVLPVIRKIRKTEKRVPIILLDDAIDARLHEKLDSSEAKEIYGLLSVLDLPELIEECSGEPSLPFYRETCLAVEIAVNALSTGEKNEALGKLIHETDWDTPYGKAAFDENGNNQKLKFSVWCFADGIFQPAFTL